MSLVAVCTKYLAASTSLKPFSSMLKNYLSIALRNFWRNKIFTLINVAGLAIGISASLLIYLLTNYHFSFDKFEKDRDRIYRVVSNFNFSGEIYKNSGVCGPMADAVRRELTGLDQIISIRTWDDGPKITVQPGGGKQPVVFRHAGNIVFADSNLCRMLNYEWLAGSAAHSLSEPMDIVLTDSSANLYFPHVASSEIIGRKLVFNDTLTGTVKGIVRKIKSNTDFTFRTLLSYKSLEQAALKPADWDAWDNTNGAQQLYIKLSANTSKQTIEKQVNALYKKNHKPDRNDHSITWYTLQPLSDLHFNSGYGAYANPTASRNTLYGLLVIAAFLLLLGCVNFINLSTAQASRRGKEIGIRKTMGSSRRDLILQVLLETGLLTFLATLLSVMITPLLLKAFSAFMPEDLRYNILDQPGILLFLLLLTIVVSLLSGFYPALVLSGYKPILVLKSQGYVSNGSTRKAWLRKSLTVSQFVIAQVFVMGAILVSKQIHYALSKDQGFRKEAIIHFNTRWNDAIPSHKFELFQNIKAIPEVVMASIGNNPPSSNSSWSGVMKYNDGKKLIETNVQQKYADSNYIKLYGIKLLAGQNLEQRDSVTGFLINETYLHLLGFQKPEDAIGKNIEWGANKFYPIRGVVADFNVASLHDPIKPVVIINKVQNAADISVLLMPLNASGTNWKTGIGKIEKAFKQIYPEDDFDYAFFDKDLQQYYESEQKISDLLQWSTGLAVFISCLGLLGLVIYTTNQRTREIGVRKVLGASVTQIVGLITKDFILLVLLAFIIAAPIAWIMMSRWLENFAYRTPISGWIFFTAGSSMVFIALITLSIQTIRAALANPVRSLRTE